MTTLPSNSTISETTVVPAGARKIESLADLDHLPPASSQHVSLAEMPIDALGGMAKALDDTREQYESLSGICGVLAGLVLIESKERVGHGNYLPFVEKYLGKSREIASQYVAAAKAFLKCQPTLTFEQLTLSLMDGAQSLSSQSLDLNHPTVSAVAQWAHGRTFYQIRQEEIKAGKSRGGDTSQKTTPLTPEEQQAKLEAALLEDATAPFSSLEKMGDAWKILNDADLETRIEMAESWATKAREWLNTPKTKRPVLDTVKAVLKEQQTEA